MILSDLKKKRKEKQKMLTSMTRNAIKIRMSRLQKTDVFISLTMIHDNYRPVVLPQSFRFLAPAVYTMAIDDPIELQA